MKKTVKTEVSKAASIMAKAKHAPGPTKEEVRAAKKVLSRHYKARRRKHLRVRSIRALPKGERDFQTWHHDFGVVLRAAAQTLGLTPAQVIEHAEQAADKMAAVVEARRPDGADSLGYRRRFGRGAKARWYEWQETFDQLVHELSPRSLDALQVVTRAEQIADLARDVVNRRRPHAPFMRRMVAA